MAPIKRHKYVIGCYISYMKLYGNTETHHTTLPTPPHTLPKTHNNIHTIFRLNQRTRRQTNRGRGRQTKERNHSKNTKMDNTLGRIWREIENDQDVAELTLLCQ